MKIDNKWKNMDAEKSKFIVEKCERVMECVINDRELIQKKANLLLGLIGGVLTLAIGTWLNSNNSLPEYFGRVLGVEIVLLVVGGVVLILTCLMPSRYAAPGGDPKLLLQPDFANQEMVWLRVGYCALIQKGIDLNLKRNLRMANWIRLLAIFVFASPIIAHFGQMVIHREDSTPCQTQQSGLSRHHEHCLEALSFHQERRCSEVQKILDGDRLIVPVARQEFVARAFGYHVVWGYRS